MARILKEQGWSVREAANGLEALALLREGMPELIFLDLIMPEMDGFAFLAEIRKTPEGCRVPVVVITGQTLTDTERRLLNTNVDRVLQKSAFNLTDVIDSVSEQLALNAPGRRTHG